MGSTVLSTGLQYSEGARQPGVASLVVRRTTTNGCVRATVVDAFSST
jgi:hypothetical protein